MTRPLFSLSHGAFGGILMVLYSLFLIQLGGILLAREKKRKKKTLFWSRWFLFLVTGIFLILLAAFSKQREMSLFFAVKQRDFKITRLPLWSVLPGLALLGTGTVVLIWKTLSYRRTTLNRLAIKESFDNLPTGLCFSGPEGFVLLANRKMEQLCFELTGEDLQDAGYFWEQLTKKTGQMQAGAAIYGEQPCFCLENQEIWTFQKDVLNTDSRQLIQLTAVNITELYHLLEQLEQKHLELKKMNGRLWQYSENMESYVRSREILETKMRIHKEIGQALLASRVYISQKIPELTEQDILKRWESVVLVLKKEAEPEVPENKWLQFVRAAGDAGVQVAASGSIPTDPVQQEYLLMAAVEALTNAVRHGEADQLKIVLTEENGYIRACFFNNGKKPIAPVREGGGLGALRIRLEEAGGSMQILTAPEFCLSVLLPKKGGKRYVTDTGPDRGRRSDGQDII